MRNAVYILFPMVLADMWPYVARAMGPWDNCEQITALSYSSRTHLQRLHDRSLQLPVDVVLFMVSSSAPSPLLQRLTACTPQ